MDSPVLMAKIERLSRCIQRIQQKTPANAALLESDLDAQDIIALNLQRAVQLCVDMATHVLARSDTPAPTSMAGAFASLRHLGAIDPKVAAQMRKAAGFRNLAVHEYASIDWTIVYSIITTQLDGFRAYAEQLRDLDSPDEA